MPEFNAPQINPFAYPSEVCPECQNEVFVPGVILKKVPGILIGAGEDTVSVPIKVAVCSKCGTLSESDKKRYDEETQKAQKAGNKPTIIV